MDRASPAVPGTPEDDHSSFGTVPTDRETDPGATHSAAVATGGSGSALAQSGPGASEAGTVVLPLITGLSAGNAAEIDPDADAAGLARELPGLTKVIVTKLDRVPAPATRTGRDASTTALTVPDAAGVGSGTDGATHPRGTAVERLRGTPATRTHHGRLIWIGIAVVWLSGLAAGFVAALTMAARASCAGTASGFGCGNGGTAVGVLLIAIVIGTVGTVTVIAWDARDNARQWVSQIVAALLVFALVVVAARLIVATL